MRMEGHPALQGELRGPLPREFSAELFDDEHRATGSSELVWRLAAEAYGEDYPVEVPAVGFDDLVGARTVCLSAARRAWACAGRPCLRPGRAGPVVSESDRRGLDRRRLLAGRGRERFRPCVLVRTPERARFIVGDLTGTGLPDRCTDAVLCFDAVFFADDRIAALQEVRRVLRAGGRYVFTAVETATPTRPAHVTDWGLAGRGR